MVLRAGPQHMPSNNVLLGMVLMVYLLVGGIYLSLSGVPAPLAFALTLADFLLLTALATGLLNFRKQANRIRQTLTCLYGTNAIISVLAMPLAIASQREVIGTEAALLSLIILVWSLAVLGHILKSALDLSRAAGMAIAIFYWLFMMQFYGWALQRFAESPIN